MLSLVEPSIMLGYLWAHGFPSGEAVRGGTTFVVFLNVEKWYGYFLWRNLDSR